MRINQSPRIFERLEKRQLLSATGAAGRIVGYLPDYESTTAGYSHFDYDGVTQINYFSVNPTTAAGMGAGNTFNNHLDAVRTTAHSHGDKISITVGGSSSATAFAAIASSADNRTNFENNLVAYCLAHQLDGADLDYESPPTGQAKTDYGTLITELHTKMAANGLILSAAVNPEAHEIPVAAAANLDFIEVMSYDLQLPNHAIYQRSINDLNGWATYTGLPKTNFVLGVPFYAHTSSTDWNATQTYQQEIDSFLTNNPGKQPDLNADTLDNVGYFNSQGTLRKKINYVIDNGFGGVMIWELTQDHFTGTQYDQYSLLPVVKDAMQNTLPNTPSIADNATITAKPTVLDWADATGATSYDVYLDGTMVQNVSSSQWTVNQTLTNSAHTWQIKAHNSVGVATGPVWHFTLQPADSTPPTVTNATDDYQSNQLTFTFSEPISSNSTAAISLNVVNPDGSLGASIAVSGHTLGASSVTFTLPANLADNNYRATLAANGIMDVAGNQMSADYSLDFFRLAGDANHDRSVDNSDFTVLFNHFTMTGMTFADGDFNGDGSVDNADFTILFNNFTKHLSAPQPAIATQATIATPIRRTAALPRRSQIAPLTNSPLK